MLSECLLDKEKVKPALDSFENTMGGNLEGKITIDEFLQIHREISMIVPNDETFVQSIESNWGVRE